MKVEKIFIYLKEHLRFLRAFALTSICLIGILFRVYRINQPDFIYFDEGYYLDLYRPFYELLIRNFPQNFTDLFRAVWFWLKFSLATGKAFWFMLVDARVFWGAYHMWSFPRFLAAGAGIGMFWFIYLFARRYYHERGTALLSVVLLALMPGHVYYSRLAMQETLSAVFFLMGFYFYLFPRAFGWRTLLAGFFLSGAFFTNYRLIILPVHLACCELILSLSEKRRPDIRKFCYTVLTFFFCIFMIGAVDHGNPTVVVFSWIFYQSNLAKEQVDIFNFFSFPYYIFRLEAFFFGLAFFGNAYFLFLREWRKALPFCLACLHMLAYSFASEKGARYLVVIYPFMIMAAAAMLTHIWELPRRKYARIAVGIILLAILIPFFSKSFVFANFQSAFRPAMAYLSSQDESPKALASQNHVLSLYMKNPKAVEPIPRQFNKLLEYHQRGYRYLILCPQIYISWGKEMKRFNLELNDFISFVLNRLTPIKVYPHLNRLVLERFVFDHNENLRRSLSFLKNTDAKAGELRVYQIAPIIALVRMAVGLNQVQPRASREHTLD